MRSEHVGDDCVSRGLVVPGLDASKVYPLKDNNYDTDCFLDKVYRGNDLLPEIDGRSKSKPFELYKRRTTVIVKRKTFLDVVCEALAEYKYVSPNQRADLSLACRYCIIYLSKQITLVNSINYPTLIYLSVLIYL